jgi:hypothetical protein
MSVGKAKEIGFWVGGYYFTLYGGLTHKKADNARTGYFKTTV